MRPDKQILHTELLVTRFQRGDRSAFDELIPLWERSLFYYLRRLAPSEADTWDLLQETWLKIFRSLKSIRDPRTFPSFLYTTARNVAVTRLRKPDLVGISPTEPYDSTTPDFAFVAFDNAEAVHHALDQLPLLQREVLTLYFLEELSIEQMADVLAVPVGTVKSRLHYAKRAMRNLLSNGVHHDQPQRTVSRATAQ